MYIEIARDNDRNVRGCASGATVAAVGDGFSPPWQARMTAARHILLAALFCPLGNNGG